MIETGLLACAVICLSIGFKLELHQLRERLRSLEVEVDAKEKAQAAPEIVNKYR
jgi:hypothetical protein